MTHEGKTLSYESLFVGACSTGCIRMLKMWIKRYFMAFQQQIVAFLYESKQPIYLPFKVFCLGLKQLRQALQIH